MFFKIGTNERKIWGKANHGRFTWVTTKHSRRFSLSRSLMSLEFVAVLGVYSWERLKHNKRRCLILSTLISLNFHSSLKSTWKGAFILIWWSGDDCYTFALFLLLLLLFVCFVFVCFQTWKIFILRKDEPESLNFFSEKGRALLFQEIINYIKFYVFPCQNAASKTTVFSYFLWKVNQQCQAI